MNNMLIPYKVSIGEYGAKYYHKLILTGRWKIASGPHYKNRMYIERKFLFIFGLWVPEDSIEFLYEDEEIINECGKIE